MLWSYQNMLHVVANNRFMKEQQAKGILSSLGAETPLSKIQDYM